MEWTVVLWKLGEGLLVSLGIFAITLLFSLPLGLLVAFGRMHKNPLISGIIKIYISFMRGTPIVAQLYFFYFGLAVYSVLVRDMTPISAVAFVLSVNVGAFMSESIRGALMSVEEGQKEAALSLGMTHFQVVYRIVLPQAIRVAIPPLFNDFINLIKSSSLAFMLGVPDIMGAARTEGSQSYRYFEVYGAVMLVYWVVISFFDFFRKIVEKRLKEAY